MLKEIIIKDRKATKKKMKFFKEALHLIEQPFFPDFDDLPGHWLSATFISLDYVIPMDVPTIQEVYNRLHELGWGPDNARVAAKGKSSDYFSHPDSPMNIWVFPREKMEGSTCERVEIGIEEVTKEVPIYEWVCSEGAEEGIFDG